LTRNYFVFLLVLPLAAHAGVVVDPWLILEKAGQAAHQLNYKGVFVYQSGTTVSSMQIMHMNYGPGGEFARLVVLDGSPREVLRQGNDAVIYQPKSEKVMIDKRRLKSGFPAVLPKLSEEIRANYQIRLAGSERIGGRDGQVVVLESHDKYRYCYKMWTDHDSGLLLKMAVLNDKDEVVEQVAFNQLLLINNGNVDWFHPEVQRGKDYVMSPEEKVTPAETQDDNWTVGKLPPGFRKTEQVRRMVPGKPFPVNHLVFWDGLASVSLFIEPVAQSLMPRVGDYSQGATNVQVSIHDGHQIVVVGEVPAVTITQITNAISFPK
jgi:sigma-E factor negative regulatory protein RseB